MSCQRCKADRVVMVGGKISDRFWAEISTQDGHKKEHDGYVPDDLGIGGGDYFNLAYCLACGQIQGSAFPLPPCKLESTLDDDDD